MDKIELRNRIELIKEATKPLSISPVQLGECLEGLLDTSLELSTQDQDVLEFPTFDDFPRPGEINTIYIDEFTDDLYRWNGGDYALLNNLDDSIVIRELSELDPFVTTGVFTVLWISKKNRATIVTTYTFRVEASGSMINQFLESRGGYRWRNKTNNDWYPWNEVIFATIADLITASQAVDYFGDTFPETALPGQLFLNTSDAQLYLWDTGQDGLAPGGWDHNDQSLSTTVYLCDRSLIPNSTDLSSYSIIINGPNKWFVLAKANASAGSGGDKSYTLDFQLTAELVQDVNILGGITIKKIIANNCAKVYLSYTGVIKQQITPNVDLEILIPDGELLTWEIERTTENSLASVGVLITV